MTSLQILLTVQIDGDAAADVVEELSLGVDAGMLDRAMLNTIRAYLAYDARDWKVAHVRCDLTPVNAPRAQPGLWPVAAD